MEKYKTLPAKNAESLEYALSDLGVELRYDVRAALIQYRCNGDFTLTGNVKWDGWTNLDDLAEASLFRVISERFRYETSRSRDSRKIKPSPLEFGRVSRLDHLNSIVANNQVDPFKEWLAELPEWDGVERCNSLLTTLWGTEDTGLVQWASRYLFLGAIHRTMHPGCVLDEFPVLIGEQNCGKSKFTELSVPSLELHSGQLQMDDSTQKQVEALLGVVVGEICEMSGSTRADLNKSKAFLTRRDDGHVRLAYRRHVNQMPRRCVFIGTANPGPCLPNDETGLRRYVPIELPAKRCLIGPVEPWLEEHREQLWAEALAMYGNGMSARLPYELSGIQAAMAEKYRASDHVIEDWVEENLDFLMEDPPHTSREILLHGEFRDDKLTQNRIHKALRNHPCKFTSVKKLVDGKRSRRWVPTRVSEKPHVECHACARLTEQNPNSKGCYECYMGGA